MGASHWKGRPPAPPDPNAACWKEQACRAVLTTALPSQHSAGLERCRCSTATSTPSASAGLSSAACMSWQSQPSASRRRLAKQRDCQLSFVQGACLWQRGTLGSCPVLILANRPAELIWLPIPCRV